ncbi:hypothetical protein RYX36_013042 [Vicia faba]
MEAFSFAGLKNFVLEKTKERYPDLVRKLYANLPYTNGIIYSEVKYHIAFSLEEFASTCNLPYLEPEYDQNYEGNELYLDTLVHSFLNDPTSFVPSPFIVGVIHTNIRLVHYTSGQILFQRKGNYNTVSRPYIHVIWFLHNQIPKNWADVVLSHMLEGKRKNNVPPYVEFITKIFQSIGYPFGEEELIFEHIKI